MMPLPDVALRVQVTFVGSLVPHGQPRCLCTAVFGDNPHPHGRTNDGLAIAPHLQPFLTLLIFVDPKYLGREIDDPGACGRGRFVRAQSAA